MADSQPELPLGLPAQGAAGLYSGIAVSADLSEEVSGIPARLAAAGAELRRASLPAGDYLVEGRVLVERKAAGDFLRSLSDGRFFAQLRYLARAPLPSLLVVEGAAPAFEQLWPRGLRSALLGATTELRVPVLFTRRPEGTALLLLELGLRLRRRRSWEQYWPARPARRRPPGFLRLYSALRRVPRVGPGRAFLILSRFRTRGALLRAGPGGLAALPGIGPALAAAVLDKLGPAARAAAGPTPPPGRAGRPSAT